MSKQASTAAPKSCKSPKPLESNENGFENSSNSIPFTPARSPLNAIPDPFQCQREFEADSEDRKSTNDRVNVCPSIGTPRVLGRGRAHGENNLGQSNSGKSVSRRLSVAGSTAALGSNQCNGGRSLSSSRSSRRFTIVNSEVAVHIPHFELEEDPSFWKDHNVQVLIRVRPLNTMEKVSQGYGRCLRQESAQTLVWLGHPETRFTFDHIAGEMITQEKLFRVAGLPMVENCMSGYNSCIFAYGQTGSGKTYTMMGEIHGIEGRLAEDCGITPRIFEYLFTRIKAEEEGQRDGKLTYSCKCSFLEIYNEQITDLIEPSSTNLQLREDLKKGVYVENLTEYNVRTVDDVLQLLLQGAANRKIAATHMNRESSRSHSVFTCIIESHWEKDSLTHRRFGRLNLVDLAGSERQKSSGAEGDRLKEAANINKSLSTLGLVIMSLVDVVHGKHRHVPYRDSKLTFLLQDSLGGNSKTTIIANVSPSLCSASETLSTLRFAQRAKLIQNNAKVNEDASGDVTALQQEIIQLKDQLSFFMSHHVFSRSLSAIQLCEMSTSGDFTKNSEGCVCVDWKGLRVGKSKVKCLEATLVDALKQEKEAQTKARRLESEVQLMTSLVRQREDESQHTRLMLQLREVKIRRLELLIDGLISGDQYLIEQNGALVEENQLLLVRIDKAQELTRVTLENTRLLEQTRLCKNINENGEQETLLEEVSELHVKDNDFVKELGNCKQMNSGCIREVANLQTLVCRDLDEILVVMDSSFGESELKQSEQLSTVETISNRSDYGYELVSYDQAEVEVQHGKNEQKMDDLIVMQTTEIAKQLFDARLLIEELKSEQVRLTEELKFMRERNQQLTGILSRTQSGCILKSEHQKVEIADSSDDPNKSPVTDKDDSAKIMVLQDKKTEELREMRLPDGQHEANQISGFGDQEVVELVHEQVDMEVTGPASHAQEDVATIPLELCEELRCMNAENVELRSSIAAKDNEMRALCTEWERATLELTNFLVDGSKSLKNASTHIKSIACLFPEVNLCLSEHVERAAKVCVEKQDTILLLQKSLEDAQSMALQMEHKLNSLKGAAIALNGTELLENNGSIKEPIQPRAIVNDKCIVVTDLEHKFAHLENQVNEVEKCAKRLSLCNLPNGFEGKIHMSKVAGSTGRDSQLIFGTDVLANESASKDVEVQIDFTMEGLLEFENAFTASHLDREKHLSSFQSDIPEAFPVNRQLVQGLMENICSMRNNLMELKGSFRLLTTKIVSVEPTKSLECDRHNPMLYQIKDGITETNRRLCLIQASIDAILEGTVCPLAVESQLHAERWSTDSSSSDSSPSVFGLTAGNQMDGTSSTERPRHITEQMLGAKSNLESQKMGKLWKFSIESLETKLFLKKELEMAMRTLCNLCVLLAVVFGEKAECCSLPHFAISPNDNHDGGYEKGHNQAKESEITQLIAGKREDECAGSFFSKFEEAHATILEADCMLNALVNANGNAKQLTNMWMQEHEKLKGERDSLLQQVQKLMSTRCLNTTEDQSVEGEKHHNLVDVVSCISSLEDCFLGVQRDLERWFRGIYLDVSLMVEDLHCCIQGLKSSLETIFLELMATNFSYSVLHACVGENLRTMPNFSGDSIMFPFRQENICLAKDGGCATIADVEQGIQHRNLSTMVTKLEKVMPCSTCDNLRYENSQLRKELDHQEVLLKGLLFDFSLLQESTSNKKDTEDETDKLITALGQVRHELDLKKAQFDELMVEYRKVEHCVAATKNALFISSSELEEVKRSSALVSDQNTELRLQTEDIYHKKLEAENQVEEQKEVIKSLEREILSLTSSAHEFSIEDVEVDIRRVMEEREQLREEVCSLNNKLEMAYALAEENEAHAAVAQQVSEANKMYAEQKEEEVRILERSIEELERTVNVLEKKVYEMDEEVVRHRLDRNSLQLEVQALRERLRTFDNLTDTMDLGNSIELQKKDQTRRKFQNQFPDLDEACNQIAALEEIRAKQDKKIEQLKEYISEIVLHAEAQASQYQKKYKTLEAMVLDMSKDPSTLPSIVPTLEKSERSSSRMRGSSSPFRCISNLVQQMNVEKEQELSLARLRIEELEALAASKQKQVCTLNSRLAAAESMTHDVIRDLLGLKLDMTTYADLVDQHQLQRFLDVVQQQVAEGNQKEQEILKLRKQMHCLIEERENCVIEINRRDADMLAAQLTMEQLKGRDQSLTMQNEMLKVEKTNLLLRLSELENMVKELLEARGGPSCKLRS
ncbi:hypothetical protein Ancab_010498 [Ancistrocladus abbreviatus]